MASRKKIKEELESREQKVAVKDGWGRLIYQGGENSQEEFRLQGLMDSLCTS